MTNNENLCGITCIHDDLVEKVKAGFIQEEDVQNLSSFFKAFGDPTRLKILHCLKHSEMCVCDISSILDMTQSAISHQLRVLRNLRLVKHRKEGKNVYYSLDDEHIFSILNEGLEHIKHAF